MTATRTRNQSGPDRLRRTGRIVSASPSAHAGGLAPSNDALAPSVMAIRHHSARLRMTLTRSLLPSKPADAGQFRHDNVAVLDPNAVREAAVRLEQIGIAFVAA